MNLIEILKSNGTGLLQGLCRPTTGQFEDLDDSELLRNKAKKVKVDFSLNEKYLGTFDIHICGVDEKHFDAELDVNGELVYLYIDWPDDADFATFKAILMGR